MTGAARRILRERFARAEVGISGVNFGVAETGTILILENEGNVRLTTSVTQDAYRRHGNRKDSAEAGGSGCISKASSAIRNRSKPNCLPVTDHRVKRNANDEGPDEVHIVLLDNGRSRMLAHPVTRQSLACIRCGACLNACPVYQQIGGHAYGSVYPGPIGAVITPQLIGYSKARQLPFASSLCGACREVCPVKIDIPELLLASKG